jgi:uncharacterized protein (TIGR00251 family)
MTGDRKSDGVTVRLAVRARPSARRSAVLGFDGAFVGVQIAAPPIDNHANDELVRILSTALHVARSHVRVVRGHTGRNKLVEIDVTPEAFQTWLSTLSARGTEG